MNNNVSTDRHIDININIVECKFVPLPFFSLPALHININIVECKSGYSALQAKVEREYKYKHSGM